jgi:prefoldin subunit 5
MDDAIDKRLAELRAELERGEARLDQLEHERQEVRDTMLRITGAIQVLRELSPAASEPALRTVDAG